jgi:RHS repeat-associated protein
MSGVFLRYTTTTYAYDHGNNLLQIVDSLSGTITRTYDNLNRLTAETTPQGSVSYTYDAANRRTAMTVNGQSSITYTYDDANRLTQLTQGSQTVVYTYDDANRRTTATLPNGILVTYGYDAASQLTDLTYTKGMTTLGTLTYQYDAAGHRTTVGGTWARTGLPTAQSTWTYNAANQLTAWDQTSVTYDANGDLTQTSGQGTTVTYTWNARHQLVGIAGGGTTASFAYDGLGRRISKTVNSTSTDFVYDGLNPVQELSGGSPVANLLSGLGIDEFVSRTEGGTTSTFLTNALGSTIALTDGTGTVQTEYTYDPFGMATVTGTSSTNAYQFTGREHDGTGLVYYRGRYYSPVLQRFISEDPIGFAGGDSNLYAYVFNSPTNFTDPTGEIIPFAVGLGAAVGGLGGGASAYFAGTSIFQGAAIGAAAGAFSGLGIGGAVGSAGIAVLANVATQFSTTGSVDGASMAVSAAAGFAGARFGAGVANTFRINIRPWDLSVRTGATSDAVVSTGAGGTAGGLADIFGQRLLNSLRSLMDFFNQGTGGNGGGPGGGNGSGAWGGNEGGPGGPGGNGSGSGGKSG